MKIAGGRTGKASLMFLCSLFRDSSPVYYALNALWRRSLRRRSFWRKESKLNYVFENPGWKVTR
jgi:hypothetical protein